VIVVPLLDSVFKKKKLGQSGLASIAMALSGVALIQLGPSMFAQQPAASSLPSSLLANLPTLSQVGIQHHALVSVGDLFCLGQALFFGIGYWRLETASGKYPNQAGRITAGQLLAVAAGSIAFLIGHDGLPAWEMALSWLQNPFVIQAALWTGLGSTALALYMETVALKSVSATELTMLMTSVSVFGSAFAYVTMGEVLPPIGMFGGALILAGCGLSALQGGEENSTNGELEELA